MLPTATDLSYFLAVVETLNIRRAAQQLGIAQPSLSLAIRRLEVTIGAPLLIRNNSGVQLTRAGKQLVPKARVLLSDWSKIRSDADKNKVEVTGRYLLGCPEGIGLYTLPGFLPKLLKTHPTLEFELIHDVSSRITDDVLNGKIDFGLVANPFRHSDLVIQRICCDNVHLWVGASVQPSQDLRSGHAVLITVPIFSSLAHISSKQMSFARTITTRSLHTVARLVAAGAGIGMLPDRVAALFRETGIRPFQQEIFNLTHDICLIYRSDAHRSPGSRRLATEIRTALKLMFKPGRSSC